ncbi:hypothetical protein SHKM778_34970 [Streptomyces sp. KM77-8]|uniref:3-oxoacyl-ACP synthase n=1 Tax=Streptomyces haneummycinicus TaxID=3074435 RepID=A0AAT9HI69_9ACTN
MIGSRIVAVGHYQPARVLTNEDLANLVDTSDEWITSRVGIRTRHIAGPDEPVDELAAHAAAKALAAAGRTPPRSTWSWSPRPPRSTARPTWPPASRPASACRAPPS